MRKKLLVVSAFTVISIIFTAICVNNYYLPYCKEVTDNKTDISYLLIEDILYPEISFESEKNGLFKKDTVDRISDINFFENDNADNQNAIVFLKKSIFNPNKYGYININDNEVIYLCFDGQRIVSIYAKENFIFPNFNTEEIEQIRIEYLDNFKGYERVVNDYNKIDEIINNPEAFFKKYDVTDIYVKYKNCNFEEWFDLNKIKSFNSETIM